MKKQEGKTVKPPSDVRIKKGTKRKESSTSSRHQSANRHTEGGSRPESQIKTQPKVKESQKEVGDLPEYLRLESIKVVSLEEKHKHVNDMLVAALVEEKPKGDD